MRGLPVRLDTGIGVICVTFMSYDASLLYSKVKVTHITPIPVSKRTGRPLICVCLYHHDYTILSFINTI
jgi:hypothetical protein